MPSGKHPKHVEGPDPIGADARRERASRRIPAGAVCLLCGERDPVVLKPGSRSMLELHHIAGRANDKDLAGPLCLNCHRKQTNRARDLGVPLAADPDRDLLTRLVAWLRGLAVFLAELADQLLEMAHRIERLKRALDAHDPSWRELPESS